LKGKVIREPQRVSVGGRIAKIPPSQGGGEKGGVWRGGEGKKGRMKGKDTLDDKRGVTQKRHIITRTARRGTWGEGLTRGERLDNGKVIVATMGRKELPPNRGKGTNSIHGKKKKLPTTRPKIQGGQRQEVLAWTLNPKKWEESKEERR